MENWLVAAALASTAFPLVQGHRALQRSTLLQAHTWASAAWLLWLLVFVADALGDAASVPLGQYLALGLTGCAAVRIAVIHSSLVPGVFEGDKGSSGNEHLNLGCCRLEMPRSEDRVPE